MTIKSLIATLAAGSAAVALTGCGEKVETTDEKPPSSSISLLLDFYPNANHSGIYQAKESGAFEKAGLKVSVKPPQNPANVLPLLASGKVDLAISYEPDVILARSKGQELVTVAAIAQKPLTSLISLPSAKIKTTRKLKGKRVGTAGIPYQSAYLKTILEQAGLKSDSAKEVNVGFNLNPALLSKKVDATLGAFWNYEGIQLTRKKKRPVIKPVDQLGVPTYNELVIVAKPETLKKKESAVRRFLRSISLGYTAVKQNPKAGVEALKKTDKTLDEKLQLASIESSINTFFPEDSSKPWGWLDAANWTKFAGWMHDNKLITGETLIENLVTNDFLPGEGTGEGRKTPGEAGRPSQPLPTIE